MLFVQGVLTIVFVQLPDLQLGQIQRLLGRLREVEYMAPVLTFLHSHILTVALKLFIAEKKTECGNCLLCLMPLKIVLF